MHISMPSGRTHGWGVAGEYLSKEIGKLKLIDRVTLHCMKGYNFMPYDPEKWNHINIGYCFFEDNIEILRYTREVARLWDFVIAGSSWCEYNLRIGGVRNTATILQGIDPTIFYPVENTKSDDTFVVFSGGKFELRKSQDIVIAAMKVFMERHADVVLSCAWYNQWPFSLETMTLSNLISYCHEEGDCMTILAKTLAGNGIPLDRVRLYPAVDNRVVRSVYLKTDIGLFPNRREGGNNMVMCEYMACGKTVIASDMTGHADVITADNAFPLTRYNPYYYKYHGSGVWFESEVDEVIELLETAYRHRDFLPEKGMLAAADMKKLSWEEAALRFHHIAREMDGVRA
jgi:glycosyltransferase involved in cell wall biosynthesis